MDMLVTGAGRGIGLALMTEALARGLSPLGTVRSAPPDLPGAAWERLEVTDPASHTALAERLRGRPLPLLVLNAGVLPGRGGDLSPKDWAQAFAVNVTGVWLGVQALLSNLRAARGKVAILSSAMGSSTRAPGGSLAYRASKAAAVNLGRNLATDLRGEGIAVGLYHPGWVRTDMGGPAAEINAPTAARGLLDRFARLSPATTGVFEDWQGRPVPV